MLELEKKLQESDTTAYERYYDNKGRISETECDRQCCQHTSKLDDHFSAMSDIWDHIYTLYEENRPDARLWRTEELFILLHIFLMHDLHNHDIMKGTIEDFEKVYSGLVPNLSDLDCSTCLPYIIKLCLSHTDYILDNKFIRGDEDEIVRRLISSPLRIMRNRTTAVNIDLAKVFWYLRFTELWSRNKCFSDFSQWALVAFKRCWPKQFKEESTSPSGIIGALGPLALEPLALEPSDPSDEDRIPPLGSVTVTSEELDDLRKQTMQDTLLQKIQEVDPGFSNEAKLFKVRDNRWVMSEGSKRLELVYHNPSLYLYKHEIRITYTPPPRSTSQYHQDHQYHQFLGYSIKFDFEKLFNMKIYCTNEALRRLPYVMPQKGSDDQEKIYHNICEAFHKNESLEKIYSYCKVYIINAGEIQNINNLNEEISGEYLLDIFRYNNDKLKKYDFTGITLPIESSENQYTINSSEKGCRIWLYLMLEFVFNEYAKISNRGIESVERIIDKEKELANLPTKGRTPTTTTTTT